MRICGVASAFPKNYYSQDIIREALKSRWSDKLERPQVLARLRGDIGAWIMHTGGSKVLEACEQALELRPSALDASWQCLARVGNLSSASVLLVLQDFMNQRRPAPGMLSVLAAMVPVFVPN
jgi:predicted naringenin-chalcone synthase